MGCASGLIYRPADLADASAVAALHTDSWRRHYRGAYSNEFLDGEVVADRLEVWTRRLQEPDPGRLIVVAVDTGEVVGFAHTVFEDDPTRGALLDNVHVAAAHKRERIGTCLLSLAAQAVVRRPGGGALYLWVLEQNIDAQAFYEALGGTRAERAHVSPPGGIPSRLASGSPTKLRYAWAEPAVLVRRS